MQDECTFKSKSIDGMGEHVKKEHLNLKEGLGCVFEKCDFRGAAMPEMKNHYSSTHESKESREAERTTCLLCGARRRTEGEVMRHIRIVHLKDNEYLCNACPQGKYATFSLKEWCNHVKDNHADSPPKIEFKRQEGFDPSKRLPMTAQPVAEEVVDLTDIPEDPKTKTAANKPGPKPTTTPARGKKDTGSSATSVQFKCSHCPDKYASKEDLLRHVEACPYAKGDDGIKCTTGSNESQPYDFLCMLCDKKTQTDEDIKKTFDSVDVDGSGLIEWTEYSFSLMGEGALEFGALADLELLNTLLTETSGLLSAMRSDLDDAAMSAAERAERNAELRARMETMKGEMQAQFGNVFSKMLGMIGKDPADLLTDEQINKLLGETFKKAIVILVMIRLILASVTLAYAFVLAIRVYGISSVVALRVYG